MSNDPPAVLYRSVITGSMWTVTSPKTVFQRHRKADNGDVPPMMDDFQNATPRNFAPAVRAPHSRIVRFTAWLVVVVLPSLRAQTRTAAEADALFRAGSAAYEAGDLRAADSAFATLVRLLPHTGSAHAAYGAVLLAEGQAKRAATELREAQRLDPKDVRAGLNLGMALRALGDDTGAVAAFRSAGAITLQPEEALAYGISLAATGDLHTAERTLKAALPHASDPLQRARLLDAMGAILAQEEQLAQAELHFRQAVAAQPQLASAHAHLGSALLLSGHGAEALQELRTAQQLGDTSTQTLVQLARAELANGLDADAQAAARAALATSPEDAEAKYTLALALQNSGDSATALPLFKAAAAIHPDNPEVLTNYGLALVQTGHAREAMPVYQNALEKGGPVPTLRENMGAAYIQQNDIDHAIEQFHVGLQADPDNVQLHYNLGLAYKLKDDVPAATRELLHAEQLDPGLPDAPYTLGVLEMQQGHFDQAAAQLETAVALQPANGEAWSLLGSVYQQTHTLDKAAIALRHAVELLPAQPSPHVTLAAVLAESGDRQGAAAERGLAADLSRAGVSRQRARFAMDSARKLMEEGKVADALTQARTALEAEPDAPEAHLLMADILDRSGKPGEAAAERGKAAGPAGPSAR